LDKRNYATLNLMKILLFIIKNLGKYRNVFYFVTIAGIVNGAVSFYIPVSLAEFANNPLIPGSLERTIVLIISLYVISLLASYIVRGRGEAFASNFANTLKLKYFRELSSLPLGKLRKNILSICNL
jgi:ABC-type multidrug transport system fused ATPase/permease subunit